DMYDGATADMGLTADPFTGGAYAFGNGNPISNIEQDGHMACADGTSDCSVQGGAQWAPKPPPASTSCLGPVLSCGGTPSYTNIPASSGSGSTGSGGLTQQQENATVDAAQQALSAALGGGKNTPPQRPSLGSTICQALLGLCQAPEAIANIPHLPSEYAQKGELWLQQWKTGWSNKIQYGTIAGSRFVTTPRGTTYKVPDNWVSRTANNGKGIVFQDPNSIGVGNGDQNEIRIMEPTTQYQQGYVRVYNQYGQAVDYNLKPGPNPATHIPEEEQGPFPELPIEP
ncbi:MAG TPA: hypothetical protein VF060_32325, partial [Trebonia sp.]